MTHDTEQVRRKLFETKHRAELAALKAQPSGVALPERFKMEPYQTVDKGSANYKSGFNACLREVARINSVREVAVPDDWVCGNCGSNVQTRLDDAALRQEGVR